MRKTIIITDLDDVKSGDILFAKGCSDGFRVACVRPVNVDNPFGHGFAYVNTDKFDHAERTVEEPKWPYPSDLEMHVYLGADGKKYLYMPSSHVDDVPWIRLPIYDNIWADDEDMDGNFPEALPLTELRLVPAKDDDDEW